MMMVGDVITYGGQKYRVTGTEPYRRRDGRTTTLYRIQSACAQCGALFEISDLRPLAPDLLQSTLPKTQTAGRACPHHPQKRYHSDPEGDDTMTTENHDQALAEIGRRQRAIIHPMLEKAGSTGCGSGEMNAALVAAGLPPLGPWGEYVDQRDEHPDDLRIKNMIRKEFMAIAMTAPGAHPDMVMADAFAALGMTMEEAWALAQARVANKRQ